MPIRQSRHRHAVSARVLNIMKHRSCAMNSEGKPVGGRSREYNSSSVLAHQDDFEDSVCTNTSTADTHQPPLPPPPPRHENVRQRTVRGLPILLSRQELADYIDPFPRATEQVSAEDSAGSINFISQSTKPKPTRLSKFVGTLPIKNYVRDFAMWDMTTEDIWERYQLLAEPRCTSISRTALRYVLNALAKESPRSYRGMIRFMSVINEMKAQNPPVIPNVAEWTAAISFLGRLHKRPMVEDLNKCMLVWDEMENKYGVRAERATFNVLLDVAVKARRWQTGDSILREMRSRKISPDRYTWSTLIQRAGFRKNGDEVRRTARLMVESGEVVDVIVINNIMSALVRAGEPDAAEHLFERIKRLTLEAQRASNSTELGDPKSRGTVSNLTSQYQYRAKLNRRDLRLGKSLTDKDVSPRSIADANPYYLSPDVATFNILLQHHCTTTGDFARVTLLLEEMERFKIPDSIAMFKSLFTGFTIHGHDNSSWNLERLQYIFETLLQTSDVRFTQDLARLAIRAFGVVGTEELVNTTFEKMDQIWQEQGGNARNRSSNVMRELARVSGRARRAEGAASGTSRGDVGR